VGEGLKTLVPNIIGHNGGSAAKRRIQRRQVHWDEESFFFNEFKQRNEADDLNTAKRNWEWLNHRRPDLLVRKKSGSFVPIQKVAN